MNEEQQPPNLPPLPSQSADFYDIYIDWFMPAFADLGAGTIAITYEIQNDVLQAFKFKADSNNERKYTEEARNEFNSTSKLYMINATLKCYKLLWISINEDLGNSSRPLLLHLCLKIPYIEFKQKHEEFVRLANEADRLEIIGHPDEVIDKLKKSIDLGVNLSNSFDPAWLKFIRYTNIKIFSTIFIIFILIRYSHDILLLSQGYLQPLLTTFSELGGPLQFILSVFASVVATILIEVYKIIKRGF